MNPSQTTRRQLFGLGSLLFAFVLLLRLVVLSRLAGSPFLLPSGGDMYFYNDWAQRILRGEATDHLAFYGLPGYAYLLALIYKVLGYSPFVPGCFQALLDAGTALLIYSIAIRLFAARHSVPTANGLQRWRFLLNREPQVVAVLAALGWAFFVPAQAYSAILMPTAWVVFAFWWVVWRIVKQDARPNAHECLAIGLIIGLTATAVATILVLLPFSLGAIFLKPRLPRQKNSLACAAWLVVGIAGGTAPCWIHNYFIARDPVFLSAHSGINFWIGNNPDANGYPRFPPGLRAGQTAMLQDSIAAAERAVGRPLNRSEVSAYWSKKAKQYIAHDPFAWAQLLLLKLRNVWNAFQYDDLSIVTSLRENGIIFPGLYFGFVAALALPGILLSRILPTTRWLLAAICLHVIALLTVFVTERYRLAIVPGLLIFAGVGLSTLWRSLIAAQPKRVAVYVCLLVPSIILTCWPQRDPSLWALDAYNSGWQALQAGDYDLAEQKLSLARSYVPTNAETNFAFGNLRLAQGSCKTAMEFYLTTLQYDPNHRGALNNLGVIALEADRYDLAEMWLRRAEDLDVRNAKTHFLLAKALLAKGDRKAAEIEANEAATLGPDQPEFKKLQQELTSGSN